MHPILRQAIDQIGHIVLGKEHQIRLSLACLLARGHLLIEDIPGVGKTTLAHALARTLGLAFQRIQFTSDLLPADILGAAIYDRENGKFNFHPGPIFAQVILADEINRASPKAQSALLEAMEEGQVSIEGETRPLPSPFFVIATQNPSEQAGVFPLPESQLDRFLMRIRLGYPDRAAERDLLRGLAACRTLGSDSENRPRRGQFSTISPGNIRNIAQDMGEKWAGAVGLQPEIPKSDRLPDRRETLARLPAVLSPADFQSLQQEVLGIHVADPLLDYLQALLAASRSDGRFAGGLSPRAGLGLLRAAQAWAYLDGRRFVQPEDLRAVLPALVAHRLFPANGLSHPDDDWAARILLQVTIP